MREPRPAPDWHSAPECTHTHTHSQTWQTFTLALLCAHYALYLIIKAQLKTFLFTQEDHLYAHTLHVCKPYHVGLSTTAITQWLSQNGKWNHLL